MRILYLTFYFRPDLCAGSFRNSPLADRLKSKVSSDTAIDIITTVPNRYHDYSVDAPAFEQDKNITIRRILIPKHHSGFLDQIFSFARFFFSVLRVSRKEHYDLVFASSSRLFTAFLGKVVASAKHAKLYLDIRDIFTDTMNDVIKSRLVRAVMSTPLKLIESYTFRHADHINLVSEGFAPYFEKYPNPVYTYFTNGIDAEFTSISQQGNGTINRNLITYAGNIGEGQGLEKIIPQAALRLPEYHFRIIGGGGRLEALKVAVNEHKAQNVEILPPVDRVSLINLYLETDFLFLHLNDYSAFEKVLPSKIFEYSAFDVPIIAGVAGYSASFIAHNVTNHILFHPGDVDDFVRKLKEYSYNRLSRTEMVSNHSRAAIMDRMADSILSYL